MEKTKFPTAGQLTQSVVELEVRLRDMMTILAAIAFLQDDKLFTVSIAQMQAMSKGSSVDFSFNKKTQEYEFRYVEPIQVCIKDDPPASDTPAATVGSSLSADNKVTG